MSRTPGRFAATGFAAGFALGGVLAACAYVAWAAGRQYGQFARLAGQLTRRWPGNCGDDQGGGRERRRRRGGRSGAFEKLRF